MSLVEIRNLTKSYTKGSSTITPLENVDLDINQGELVSLMGTSGTGKSTLLNLVAGIDRPDDGTIAVNGTEITFSLEKPHSLTNFAATAEYVAEMNDSCEVE